MLLKPGQTLLDGLGLPRGRRFETELFDPAKTFGPKVSTAIEPVAIPDERVPLPDLEPLVLKGNHAAAIGAILAGSATSSATPLRLLRRVPS